MSLPQIGPQPPALTTAQPARSDRPTTRAIALAWVRFERPDPTASLPFLVDFGLQPVEHPGASVWLRSAGGEPFCYRIDPGPTACFVGFGLEVQDRAALERLAALPEASPITALDGPGGGSVVRLTDPAGFVVEAVCGRAPVSPTTHRAPLPLNCGSHARVNTPQRPPIAPPAVRRLGHLVLEVVDYQATCGWYTRHFGFIPSDVQVLPDGAPGVTFLRLDRGETPTDHHTLALAQGVLDIYSHAAFEVIDTDAVAMGQRILRERGHQHAWGMGRHILGSQIFDYWTDAFGCHHEHYCDGDLFTADVPLGVHLASRAGMAQWGPPMPARFTRPRLSAGVIRQILHNIRRSPDLTLSKLRALVRLFG